MSAEHPTLDRLSAIHADGSRRHIQTADVSGPWVTRRRVVYAALIAIYVALPFFKVDGRPAVQLDVAARRFYLFGAVFNAQDFWRAIFVLLFLGAALLFLTAWLGRVWCGWACPQTVFLEGVYRRIERLLEGPREARIRLAKSSSPGAIARRFTKHALYVLVSLGLAHVALAFFVSLPGTFELVRHDPRENWTAFLWVMACTGALYFNFAWFREQLCIVVCPYGRLQSALLDRDSVIVGYDTKRGEPRGKRSRALPVVQDAPKGDCVDCARCVNVCPTGIDIRNGTQMECIGCTACMDACDDVMSRLGRPTGLIRYDSQNGLENQPKRVARPRLVLYGGLVVATLAMLVVALATRSHLEANLLRGHGAPYVLDSGEIRNQFELHLVNKNPGESTLSVEVVSPRAVDVKLPMPEVKLASLDHFRLPVFVSVHDADFKGPFELTFVVRDTASHEERRVTTSFLGPVR